MNHPLSVDQLDLIEQPIETARGLPNAVYTDPDCFVFEREHVLGSNWAAIAFVDRLENAMVRPMEFMGLPILLSKSKDGVVRVFHNVCSHRGMKLVDQERLTNGLVVCPYHSWTYSLAGDLKATPHIGGVGVHSVPGFSCEDRGLREIRSHIWLGILFINLDGNATEFEQDHSVAIERARLLMGDSGEALIGMPEQHGSLELELQCNWKLAVENYLEAYHLPFIHPGLNSYSPLDKHFCEIHGEKTAGQFTSTFTPDQDSDNPLPMFPDWDPDRKNTGDYPAVYPNLLLGFQADHLFALILHPLSTDRCREEIGLFYVGDGASDSGYDEVRKTNLEVWTAVFNEDVGPCERMQAGRQSPGYIGGGFSPVLDRCSHHFHKWIGQHYRSEQ